MNFGELRNFLEIVQCGSFSAAAEALKLTQPALSRQVQRLEHELGAPLFDRAGRKLRLTKAGERFRTFAQAVVTDFDSIRSDLRSQETSISGGLLIAASTTPGEFVLPDLLGKFTRQHPGVRPLVSISDSAQVLLEVSEGKVELGFVGDKTRAPGIEYAEVAEDEIVLAVPSAHPLARRKSVPPEDLDGLSFIDRERGSGTLQSVRRILAEHGLKEPSFHVAMVLNSVQAIMHAVESGHGASWVSTMALTPQWDGRIVPVRIAGIPLLRRLYLINRQHRHLSPQASVFRTMALTDRTSQAR